MSYLSEKNIIGALLVDINSLDKIHDKLKPAMFENGILRRIYIEFLRAYDNNYELSVSMLEQELQGEQEENALLEELKRCLFTAVTSVSVVPESQVIINDYKSRMLKNLINHTDLRANNIELQIGELISELEVLRGNEKIGSKPLSQIVKENKENYFCDVDKNRIYTGFHQLDEMLGGLEGGDVIVIGARPGVGKSAFVTQITSSVSRTGKRVGFYNLEMQEAQVYERFIVSESGIGLTRLRRAKNYLNGEKERFEKANDILLKKDNIVLHTGSKSPSQIRSGSRHMAYDIIIIDYLQLLKPNNTYRGNRYAEVGENSRAIKALAMELNIPIIVLSQLNRVSEMKETKEPTMSELREAGDIEQDASVIILLWNLSSEDRSKKGCKIDKQRQGKTGTVVLNFNGDLMKFEESNKDLKQETEWIQKQVDDDCPFR